MDKSTYMYKCKNTQVLLYIQKLICLCTYVYILMMNLFSSMKKNIPLKFWFKVDAKFL